MNLNNNNTSQQYNNMIMVSKVVKTIILSNLIQMLNRRRNEIGTMYTNILDMRAIDYLGVNYVATR